jgi:DNA-binding beta-propeller fold protein YncE
VNGFFFGNAVAAGGVAIDPSGRWVFETDSNMGVIYTYSKTFLWDLLGYSPPNPPQTSFAAGAGAGPMAIDPSGSLLFVGNQAANTISVFHYFGTSPQLFESTASFVLPYSDGSPFTIGAKPLALSIGADGTFLFVLCGD